MRTSPRRVTNIVDEISLSGAYFGAEKGTLELPLQGGTPLAAVVSTWSDRTITFRVDAPPDLIAGEVSVVVTRKDGMASEGKVLLQFK